MTNVNNFVKVQRCVVPCFKWFGWSKQLYSSFSDAGQKVSWFSKVWKSLPDIQLKKHTKLCSFYQIWWQDFCIFLFQNLMYYIAVYDVFIQFCIQKKFGDNVFSWGSGLLPLIPAKFYWFILFCTLLATSF